MFSEKILAIIIAAGAIGSFVGGAISLGQYLYAPQPISGNQDFIVALEQLSAEVSAANLSLDDEQKRQVAEGLDEFTLSVAQSTFGIGGDLPSVPRSISGTADYPHGVAFDFVAPNGASRLLVPNAVSGALYLIVDGSHSERLRIGRHVTVPFGELVCRFDLIDFESREFMRVRSACE